METKQKKPYYITTAIAYASRKPHIGNTYEIILTDAIARHKRQLGYDVFFCTGTDEHGQKIEGLAAEAGVTPRAYVDGVAGVIRGIWDKMNTSYDYFIRTTDEKHERVVQHIFKKLYAQGDIYKNEYEGWYCVPCESFYTNIQLVDGKCPDCGRPVQLTKEESYFFKTSKYAPRLIEHIEQNPGFIEPESRAKEMLNNFLRVDGGLQDLCVSRTSFKWGIPVNFDPKHVVYVWIDALSNYITALGYDVDEQGELYRKFWPADLHVIGKDIVRFHTIYWPIILMALGVPLPKKIYAHGWLLFGQDKMSKSKGNVLYADELAEKFGVDGVRHYVLGEMPYQNDGSISYESLIKVYNTDLANNLGNLVSRTLAMTAKYFDGVIPSPVCPGSPDEELIAACGAAREVVEKEMDALHVADAQSAVFELFRRANKYIDETMPWALAKDESKRERLGTVLYNLLETIRIAAVLLLPFMPETAEKIFAMLGIALPGCDGADYDSIRSFGALIEGTKVNPGAPLFARIDEAAFLREMEEKEAVSSEASSAEAAKPAEPAHEKEITIEDFMAVELRCAKVIDCKPVPKAKKLLCLQLDLGYETRQVVSGIAKWYTPEELIGRKVAVVCNLKPATLCGVESEGMILASGEDDVKVIFPDESVPLGARIR